MEKRGWVGLPPLTSRPGTKASISDRSSAATASMSSVVTTSSVSGTRWTSWLRRCAVTVMTSRRALSPASCANAGLAICAPQSATAPAPSIKACLMLSPFT